MTEINMKLEDWLDDLCLESVERICFQVEEAQWFYEDFIRPLDPALPSLSLKAFALRIFQHCPLMSQWSHYHHMTAFSEFLAYKTRVPVRGAIMLNQEMDEVVLVKGWKKGANWSFPRGKINKDEKDLDCAIREVYEETGYDIHQAGLVKDDKDVKFIEITMREQHMRLYVFRDVPRDAYFEPRTRKEISKIEWYKLSELPTLKRSKQQDQGVAVANANKFYMVAPFMHPLKKWIAQQKKLDMKNQVGPRQVVQSEGDMSMDEGGFGANSHYATPNLPRTELAVGSDLPEVASSQDASAHLKRLLNINNMMKMQGQAHPAETPQASNADPLKSNALLELLRSGSQGPTPEKTTPREAPIGAPPPLQPVAHPGPNFFPGFPQQHPFPGQFVNPTPPKGASMPPLPPMHSMNQHAMAQGFPAQSQQMPPSYPPQSRPAQPFHPGMVSTAPFPPPNPGPASRPYQRTGDPEFSQPPRQLSQVEGAAVPPANNLPPPKLTSHSLALLNVFKDEAAKTPKSSHATLAPQTADKTPANGRRSSQHQDQLLNLLKGSPSRPAPVELPGRPVSPAQRQILQRPRGDGQGTQKTRASSRTTQPSGTWTAATVSGPLDIPQSAAGTKPPPKRAHNGPHRKAAKDRQAQPLASPITILPRPQSAKKEAPPAQAPARPPSQPSRNSSQPRSARKQRSPEAPKPFQPQILRRTENADNILPIRPKEAVNPEKQEEPKVPSPRQETGAQPSTAFDRRPSQTTTQKETLLSLFGKPTGSPGVSPSGQLDLQTSVSQPPAPSSVVSPLSPFNLPARTMADTSPDSLPPPPPATGYARLTNRGLISITGADSTTFLQGLITQNMMVANDPNRAIRHTGSYTAFLNSHGRVLNDAFLYPQPRTDDAPSDDPAWLIEVDKNEVPSLLKHLKKHKLRAKLKLRALDDGERTIWSAWKNHAEPRWAAYNLESQASSPFSPDSSIAGCVDTRAPGFGSRLVTPGAEDLRAHLDESKVAGGEVDLGSYTVRRMLHGVAEGQSEILRESALPLECNMDMMRAVDFRKGCYVGQELTIRTHHTGVVRKRILPVQLYDGGLGDLATDSPVYDPSTKLALPPRELSISKAGGRRGRSAGKFLNGVGNIGLALCRLEMMTDISLTGEGTMFSPDQEFQVSWTASEEGSTGPQQPGEVKLKAIVPPWTKDFILSGGMKNTNNQSQAGTEGHRARDFVDQLGEEEAEQQRRHE
ncbi:hypothetical protein P168DRAFT_311180 [Aspergillus campestris IBT 28561]|uniref:Iron-sulfur cluster assembly factor IBA57 homolog, mitochondrial n=1 Tax=Aspergillus campestris (strain IBT 28561) TaxID=1392248 RepID=A0A2I1D125_ASPC2|nr:uncharacterized protein P168DRAFT_311180 [Aspergillus campestris IBT 28561]PKY03571.1 hypothetical protein P168DRAFT_311180 [Aspergillus campestris IBT 28561]